MGLSELNINAITGKIFYCIEHEEESILRCEIDERKIIVIS